MPIFDYDRETAVNYALRWALSRNPRYYDFDLLGGDCTNFCSQCLFQGAPVMNYTKTFGWYFISLNDRSPSWSGVEFFYNFLVNNNSIGPFGEETTVDKVELGDFIQLADRSLDFYHNLIVTDLSNGIKVSAHTIDSRNRPLDSYNFYALRCIKILGVRN